MASRETDKGAVAPEMPVRSIEPIWEVDDPGSVSTKPYRCSRDLDRHRTYELDELFIEQQHRVGTSRGNRTRLFSRDGRHLLLRARIAA
jgi:hypothetical protein